ncbi:hypothetical protein NDU88_010287 [Pleurodeles waltl]|uniref:Uncharacterized protein n=1 Tax=Pleurodeles waltl TaxID=8319 RepID=A0AAV7PXV9_PLEWA|nr:hypothetical protein NDU88_010287 [Pleurodeles waltl]
MAQAYIRWLVLQHLVRDPVDAKDVKKEIIHYFESNTHPDITVHTKVTIRGPISSVAIAQARKARLIEKGLVDGIKALER